MRRTLEEKIAAEKEEMKLQGKLTIQGKALAQLVRAGEAVKHTVIAECTTNRKNVYAKEEFTIWKITNIYRAKPELIEKHRAYLLKKYNGVIPYKYE